MSSDFVMKTMDTDKSLSIESEEVDNSTLDFKPVRTLELCVKSASKITKPACLFIADAEILLKRRTLERSLIEGVKERDSSTLKTALAEIATSPDGYGVAPELHNPAKEIIAMLEIEDELVEGVMTRNKDGELAMWIEKAKGYQRVDKEKVDAGVAELEKLAMFETCRGCIKAEDPDGLKSGIDGIMAASWKTKEIGDGGFWYEIDKTTMRELKLAYKKLSVLVEIEKYIDPLSAIRLQSAYEDAIEAGVSHELVTKAKEILDKIDREQIKGEFNKKANTAGGGHGTANWNNNPQFYCHFKEGGPETVKISFSLKEGGGADGEEFFGPFTLHVLRNQAADKGEEAMPEAEVLAAGEYDEESTILTIDELDSSKPFVICPSTQVEGEEGPFVLNILVETIGADVTVTPVVKVGELVMAAIKSDNLDELERLLDDAKERDYAASTGQRAKSTYAAEGRRRASKRRSIPRDQSTRSARRSKARPTRAARRPSFNRPRRCSRSFWRSRR